MPLSTSPEDGGSRSTTGFVFTVFSYRQALPIQKKATTGARLDSQPGESLSSDPGVSPATLVRQRAEQVAWATALAGPPAGGACRQSENPQELGAWPDHTSQTLLAGYPVTSK